SYAPNGRMILFATVIGGRGLLSAGSARGRVQPKLSAAPRRARRERGRGPRRGGAGLGPLHRITDAMQKGDAMRAYYLPIVTAFAAAVLIAGCSTSPTSEGDQSGAPVTDATKPGAKPGAGAQTGPIAKIDVTKPGAVAGADPRLKTGALPQRCIYS